MNKVILSGYLAKEIVLNYTKNGKPYILFNLAVKNEYVNNHDEKNKLFFFKCIAWGKKAITMKATLLKGEKILVEGYLSNRSYVDKNNIKRFSNEVNVSRFEYAISKYQKSLLSSITNGVLDFPAYEDVYGMSEDEYKEWIASDF